VHPHTYIRTDRSNHVSNVFEYDVEPHDAGQNPLVDTFLLIVTNDAPNSTHTHNYFFATPQVDSEDNLKGAFKVFDPELAGFIDPTLLKQQLTTLGEPLTKTEWEEFAAVAVQGGKVDYQLFVNTVYSSKQL
jgi:hypothetical protein